MCSNEAKLTLGNIKDAVSEKVFMGYGRADYDINRR